MLIKIKTLLLAATAALLATLPRVEAAATTYGHNSTLSSPTSVIPGVLIVNKITVTTAGSLTSLGVLTHSAGANANLGVYKADGAEGKPGTLVAQTGAFAVAAGTNEHPATTPVILAAGDYWIGGLSDDAPGGTLAIIAQEGTQAADAPVGALWKSFTSAAAPGGGAGVIILGFMTQGGGGITSANDNGVWSADSSGVLHLVMQEGTTVLDGNPVPVKSFAVLKAVSGSPGQTHAHNTNGELVSKVTFANGAQAVVQQFLP